MALWMHWLTIKVHKQEVPCAVICTPYHALIIQQPSLHNISSSKFSAQLCNWPATATYVGGVYHCVYGHLFLYFVSQCIHALNHPYMGYDFFLQIFYGDLFLFIFDCYTVYIQCMCCIIVWVDTCSTKKMATSIVAHCLEIVGRHST